MTNEEAKVKEVVEWGRKNGVKGCFGCFGDHVFRLDGSKCMSKCAVCKSDFTKGKRHLVSECSKLPTDRQAISEMAERALKDDQKRSRWLTDRQTDSSLVKTASIGENSSKGKYFNSVYVHGLIMTYFIDTGSEISLCSKKWAKFGEVRKLKNCIADKQR